DAIKAKDSAVEALAAANKNVTELTEKISGFAAAIQKQDNEIKAAKTKVADAQGYLDTAKQKQTSAETELKNAKQTAKEKDAAVKAAEQNVKEAIAAISAAKESVKQAKDKVAQAQSALAAAKTKVTQAQTKVESYKTKFAAAVAALPEQVRVTYQANFAAVTGNFTTMLATLNSCSTTLSSATST
ncbi:hypothetical protein CG403_04925, partial [Gardnerella vaginalis]